MTSFGLKYPSQLLFIPLIFFLLVPSVTFAQLDNRCFTESECIADRKLNGVAGTPVTDSEARAGFYKEPDAISVCGKEKTVNGKTEALGFCLPVGQTVTAISFGGKSQFANIGSFIQYMYRYGILAASILAVVMIIVAGLQWTMSGGNTATIDSAKKRISGALVGLFLAVISYTILNTINPFLVNFRLPQVWMVRNVSFPISTCNQVETGKRVGFYRIQGEEKGTSTDEKKQAFSQTTFSVDPARADCGQVYFIESSAAEICHGVFCEQTNFACVQPDLKQKSICMKAGLTGNIEAGPNFGDPNEVIDNNLNLVALCENGHTRLVGGGIDAQTTKDGRGQFYLFPREPVSSLCSGDGGLLGYYLVAEVNDTRGAFGIAIAGSDDWHAIGRDPQNTNLCNVNLSKWVRESLSLPVDCGDDAQDSSCSCEGIADTLEGNTTYMAKLKTDLQKYLFTQEELQRGTQCNIHLDRSSFPALDESVVEESCDE